MKFSIGQVICVDIDGVLADFEQYFCDNYGYHARYLVKLEERYPELADEITKFVANPNTYSKLQPLEFGMMLVKWLDENGYTISLVSSRPDTTLRITKEWLEKYKVPYTYLHVSGSKDKIKEIVRLQPVVAIDDLGEVGQELSRYGIKTILVSQYWNRNFIGKFPRISEFSSFLREFYKILEVSEHVKI